MDSHEIPLVDETVELLQTTEHGPQHAPVARQVRAHPVQPAHDTGPGRTGLRGEAGLGLDSGLGDGGELLELVGHPIRVVRRGEGLLSSDAGRHALRQGPVDRRAHDSPPATVRPDPTRTTESERDPTEVQPSSLG